MRIRGALLVLSLATTLVAVGCGDDQPAVPIGGATTVPAPVAGVDLSQAAFVDLSASPEVEVDAIDNEFKEPYIEVKAGATITFRNDGRNTHDVYPALKGAFADIETADFEPGAESTITLDEPGDYPYYCSLHGTTTKGMVGAIRVLK